MTKKIQSLWFLIYRTILTLVASSLIAVLALGGIAAAQNPVPVINQPLVPDAVKPMGASFTLSVNGTGFVPGAVVRWGGSARTTKFVSKSKLTAAIQASDIAKAQTAPITVFNPGPGGGESNIVFFDVTPPSPSIALNTATFSSAGVNPTSVAVGDFNRDGKLDLAVATENQNSITVLLGKGDGTFNAPVHYAVGSPSESVIAADINGDGKADLAVTDLNTGNVSVLLGNGDGTFRAALRHSVGQVPYALAVGDFNADSKLDLAVTNNGSSNVSVLLGNGDGTFQSAVEYMVALDPTGLAVGDFNRDGKLDLVVSAGNGLNLLLGIGDGTFEPAVNFEPGAGGNSVVVADFNRDGALDLAVAGSVLLGNGDGTFRPVVNYDAGTGPDSVAVADFNGDGKLDLVVAHVLGNGLRVLLGNGDGTFKVAAEYVTSLDLRSTTIGDFNGDGALDIALANYNGTAGVLVQIPFVSRSKESLIFPDQSVGSTGAAQTVRLNNISALPVNIGGIAITGANATDFGQTHTCTSTLAPAANCTITVTLGAMKIGPRAAAIRITDNASQNPQSISLSGTGVISGPNATLAPASLNFVPQLLNTPSAAKSIKLANYGTLPLDIAKVFANGDFIETNSCGSTVSAGASCTVGLSFKPTQTGLRTGTLSIMDNALGSPQMVRLRGAGTVVKLVPTRLSFGTLNQCRNASQTITLTNIGSTALTIGGIQVTPESRQAFAQTNNCGSTVAAGKSCTVTVTFSTGGLVGIPPGSYTDSVVISDNGGGGSEGIPLSGSVRLCHECCF